MGERQDLDGEEKEEHQQKEGLALKIWDCGSPLYDSYELVSIADVIDRHLMTFPYIISRSIRSATRPSSCSASVPLSLSSTMSHPSRKVKESSFMPCLKLWKMKMNKGTKVKIGILKICRGIVSWRK
ncbi:hypothetical protein Ccrd_008961 [Cynara cardunculus var. scolymus]|uniref:Uncharacterized protein n=1 Tax=Cynara cardunculus var. scolymus TaxID=59895 RepID=A0A103XE37_CYNCS|nr:hypothetical protein Ccrd_008961 [Cynara cardunculus var. scolymus]